MNRKIIGWVMAGILAVIIVVLSPQSVGREENRHPESTVKVKQLREGRTVFP